MAKNLLGQTGESVVTKSLVEQKFTILATNYRLMFGEIDIIAQKDDIIAFVEVKTRKQQFGAIGDLVNYAKQKKIVKAANHYISTNNFHNKTYRFDVAFVEFREETSQITYIQNAFSSEAS